MPLFFFLNQNLFFTLSSFLLIHNRVSSPPSTRSLLAAAPHPPPPIPHPRPPPPPPPTPPPSAAPAATLRKMDYGWRGWAGGGRRVLGSGGWGVQNEQPIAAQRVAANLQTPCDNSAATTSGLTVDKLQLRRPSLVAEGCNCDTA